MNKVYFIRRKIVTLRSNEQIKMAHIVRELEQLKEVEPKDTDKVVAVYQQFDNANKTCHQLNITDAIERFEVENGPGLKSDYYVNIKRYYVELFPLS